MRSTLPDTDLPDAGPAEAGRAGPEPLDLADHLTPEAMQRAHRRLVAKALAEFSHERLLEPRPVMTTGGAAFHEVCTGGGAGLGAANGTGGGAGLGAAKGTGSTYRFHAHRHELDHWVVDPWSVTRERDGLVIEPDALELIVELHTDLGIPEQLLGTYLEEISATLAAAAWKDAHHVLSADDLLDADLQTIEGAMTQGHPAFVANNGRIGFGLDDYRAFAPEAGQDVHLVWLGVRRTCATLSCGDGLEESALYAAELDADERDALLGRLRHLGLDPDDYLLMPAHPWQWTNKLAVTFAADVARRDIVPLGAGRDAYRPQQSIRTFFNTTRPDRQYVKTALSIQNMGFMRGLSPHYMDATPAINDWVQGVVASDVELRSTGFDVLRERAALGYTGGVYQQTPGRSPYQKMFSALWRESPGSRLAPTERAATMAALLHRDRHGQGHAAALVRASGLDPAHWVRRYLDAYLRPVAYCLWAHDLAFMPHGENVILVLEDHAPVRILMKDIGEEVAVLDDGPLPEGIERIRTAVPEGTQALSILTDVLDGFLRFLAADLAEDGVLDPGTFWSLAASCLRDLQADHPELTAKIERYDLFVEAFDHSCLNRLQLRNTLEMVDLSDQAQSLLFAGTLDNPLARYDAR
ncbi:IucA/IucC family protein [Aeromicrobium sp. CTD01-1L150]|uniref:IucA/IucC family protein n=1 Tax=Aeromicrobium sp. CTD01-1L150 TaxID=3341830 RepID=UPI0035C263C3